MKTKEPQGVLNDSQRATNNRKEYTKYNQVSPKGASIPGNTTKTNGFSMTFKTAKAPQAQPKCPQGTLKDSQKCPKGPPRTPMASPRPSHDSLQEYPRIPRTPQGTPKETKGRPWRAPASFENH